MRTIRSSRVLAITSALCLAGAGAAVAAPELPRGAPNPTVAVTFAKPDGNPTPASPLAPPLKRLRPVTVSPEAHKHLVDGAYRAIGKPSPALPPQELMKVSFTTAPATLRSAQWATTANLALGFNGQVEAWVDPTTDAPTPTPSTWASGTALRVLAEAFVAGNPYVLECSGMPSPKTATPVSDVPVNFYVSFQTSLGGSPSNPAITEQKVPSISVTNGRAMAIAFAAPSSDTWINIRVAHPQIWSFTFDTCTVSNLN